MKNVFISRRIFRPVLSASLAISIIMLSSANVWAQELTSTSFKIIKSGFSQLGGYSTTTDFSAFESSDPAANGESTSTSFYLSSGYLYYGAFTPVTQNWRWYGDAENETPTVALASENVAPTNILDLVPIKLRISLAETGGVTESNAKFRLQYATTSDFSEGAIFVTESSECTPTSVWCYTDGGGSDNALITTKVLSDADSCAAGVGVGCGTHNESGTSTSAQSQIGGAVTEYEFAIKQSGGVSNTVYFFRLFDTVSSSSVPLNTGKTYPSLSVFGTTLTFSISGLNTGTTTEGVTTDVGTSPTSVPFGHLSFGSPALAAHRLTVSTTASQGYKVFAYQRQGLLNQSAYEIPPVSGTNSSPLGWSSGCAATSSGCYGYHSGDDVLEGGSTRFAADDTYAQFTSSPVEVAYSSGPVSNKTTDIVYKVQVTTGQQSGDYDGNIVYIVTPVF